MDHSQVDPAFGTPADLRRLAAGGTWVADAVVNHVSAQGTWFRRWLAARPGGRGLVRHARRRHRHLGGHPPAHEPAAHRVHPGRRLGGRGVDDVLRRPGRPGLPRARRAAGHGRGAARLRRPRRPRPAPGRHRLRLEGPVDPVDQPARHPPARAAAARLPGRGRPRPGAGHRDQRAARGERRLPGPGRRARGPGGLPVRPAAAHAARVRHRRRAGRSSGGRASCGSRRPGRRTSTSSPATTASACARSRACCPRPRSTAWSR